MSIDPQPIPQSTPEQPTAFTPPNPPIQKTGKMPKLILLFIGLFLFTAGGIAGYVLSTGNLSSPKTNACTMEAKLCPDGSSVGRSGPNCEFTPCPTTTLNPTADWKTYTNTKYGYEVKLPPNFTGISGGMTTSEMDQTSNAIRLLESNHGDIAQSKNRFTISLTNSISKNTTLENDAKEHFDSFFTRKLTPSAKESLFKDFGYEIIDNEIVTPLKKSTFLGNVAYEYTINGNSVSNGLEQYIHPIETYNYIWFDYNTNRYLLTFPETPLMHQILSTFKITTKPGDASSEVRQVAANFLQMTGHDLNTTIIYEPEKLGNLTDVYAVSWIPSQKYVGGGMFLLIGKENNQWIIPNREDQIYCEWVKSSGVDSQTESFMGCQ